MSKRILRDLGRLAIDFAIIIIIVCGIRSDCVWFQCIAGFICGFLIAEGVESVVNKLSK